MAVIQKSDTASLLEQQAAHEKAKPDTATLLEQQAAHEKAKSDHIAALLKESTDLAASTETRQKQIALDLTALGYKKPRAARTKKEGK